MSDNLKHLLLLAEQKKPRDGHTARFEQKLKQSARPRNRKRIFQMSALAAAAAGLILIVVINGIQSDNEEFQKRSLSDISPQTKALELQMSEHITKREAEVDFENPALFNQIKVYRSLQIEFSKLENDLNLNFGDERLIRAMMDNYQHRLKVLENILLIKRLNEQQLPSTPHQINSKS
ncbi:MAG: hypothetical protein GC193_02580 [Cryomorphaceae bacterium]|nr:hypothetical protein [Cryomorphaceae bacterium]